LTPQDVSLNGWLISLVGAGVTAVVGLYFRGILGELRAVTADLREVVKTLTAQDKTLALTVLRVDRLERTVEAHLAKDKVA
jgi:hypothetical protein